MLKPIKNYIKKVVRQYLDEMFEDEEEHEEFQEMVDEAVIDTILRIVNPHKDVEGSLSSFCTNDTYKKLQKEVAKSIKTHYRRSLEKIEQRKDNQVRMARKLTDYRREIKSEASKAVDNRVGGEEFLDEIVMRLKAKQLPGGE